MLYTTDVCSLPYPRGVFSPFALLSLFYYSLGIKKKKKVQRRWMATTEQRIQTLQAQRAAETAQRAINGAAARTAKRKEDTQRTTTGEKKNLLGTKAAQKRKAREFVKRRIVIGKKKSQSTAAHKDVERQEKGSKGAQDNSLAISTEEFKRSLQQKKKIVFGCLPSATSVRNCEI